jgi:hypothetical protein
MRLPNIDQLEIASPCQERWRDMQGDDRVRLCGKCRQHVYNFETFTRAEIEALLLETEGRLCARLFQRKDGTILTADCPVGRASRLRRLALAATAAALFLLGNGLLLALHASQAAGADSTWFASWLRQTSGKVEKTRTGNNLQYVGKKGGIEGFGPPRK